MSVGVMEVLWTFPRWLSIHSLAHTLTKAIWPSLSPRMPPLWFGSAAASPSEASSGQRKMKGWQKDGENRAGRGQRCGGRDSAEGWHKKPFGVWSEFGEQMAWARGGACLVLATLHKSHSSPLRGSRVTVQWESMGITSREKRMNGRRGARPLPLLFPPLCHTALAHGYKRARAVISTHMRSRKNFD